MTRLDWPGLMYAGLAILRLRPAEFWALTPAELQMMLGLTSKESPMDRSRLDALARAFPDKIED
ncbi:rcc01693 family protein [Yoonia sp. BS5-3]|uniref:Rcc01693 family protein n=1 Tax=Yoonia phaeophyticola TaxID=3137369 RepID=A0ABZ2V4F1_9RHOB